MADPARLNDGVDELPAAGSVERCPPRNLFFISCLLLLLCIWFGLARAGLMLRNAALLGDVSSFDVLRPFAPGLRFDLATACYLLVPLSLFVFLPFLSIDRSPRMRRVFYWLFLSIMGVLTYVLIAEFEYFREFQVRYNQLVINYLDQPATVGGMIWHGYPILSYTLLWLTAMLVLALSLRWLMRWIYAAQGQLPARLTWRYCVIEFGSMALVAIALVFGIRGGFQGTPLRWGDAFRSEHDVLNQFSLNGLYTLGRTLSDHFLAADASRAWLKQMTSAQARSTARALILDKNDRLIAPEDSTVLRIAQRDRDRTISLKPGISKPNVVVVIMESFSAQFSAACGATEDDTPYFDAIARDGILFDRNFSIGTHTHQGIFGTLLSFPNLPGYEALMQSPLANQPFTSLPGILSGEGYQTMFLYNGNFDWDNMHGFFCKQGMDRFIGGQDFDASVRRDTVWGVDDLEVFRRANREFAVAAAKGPFMGVILTLSNHTPWDLPHFAGELTTGRGSLAGPIRGIRYADWSVGQFMEEARKLDYFNNTLFVFVGDHGSRVVGAKLTAANLLVHHVPLLFYGPGVLDGVPRIDHTVASQLNIVPTVLGLLDVQRPQASWGTDLFTADGQAQSFALFKGTGGDDSTAMVRGDHTLVIDEGGTSVLYHYSLAGHPTATPISSADPSHGTLRNGMLAIIHAALVDLRNMKAGNLPPTVANKPPAPIPAAPQTLRQQTSGSDHADFF